MPLKEQQLFDKGVAHYNNQQYKKAGLVFGQLIHQVKMTADQQLLGQLYFNLSTFYQKNNAPAKSLELLLDCSDLLGDKFTPKRSNIIIPAMKESPSTYLLEIPKDASLICDVYNKIGGVYFKQKDYQKAKKYWKKAYHVADQYSNGKALANVSNNLGELEQLQKNYSQALDFYQYALFLQTAIKDSFGILVSWGNIGTTYLKNAQLDSAKHYYTKAYELAQVLGDSTQLLYAYKNNGALYQVQNKIQQALNWNKKALEFTNQQVDLDVLIEIHKSLTYLYKEKKSLDSLLIHQTLWTALQKEQRQQEKTKILMQVEAEYIVNQQEREVARLREQVTLEHEKSHHKHTILMVIALFFFLFSLVVLRMLSLTKKHNKEVCKHLKAIEQQNKEKEILIKEIHHRVKNNLQVITSLLHLQSNTIQDPKIKALFNQSQYRINSMSMIHKMLYQSHNLSAIDYQDYLKQLIHQLVYSIKGSTDEIQLDLDIAPIQLDIDTAIPLGLLITELVTNALKYGLDKGKESILTVHLSVHSPSSYLLEVGDNGKGMPTEPSTNNQSLGLRLIQQLARQLEGELTQIKEKSGTHYKLYFQKITTSS